MENVFVVKFAVESEAYQAFTEIKTHMGDPNCVIPQMVLVKKVDGRIIPCDGYNEKFYAGGTMLGGLLGMFVGILGGPLGVILGGTAGAMVGSVVDGDDVQKDVDLLMLVSSGVKEGEVAIIALVQELNDGDFAAYFAKYRTTIRVQDAAAVYVQVAKAMNLQNKMAAEVRERLHQEKVDEFKDSLEQKRSELKAEFDAVRANLKNLREEYAQRYKI